MSSRRVTLLVYPTTPQSRRFCVESMDALCSLSRRNLIHRVLRLHARDSKLSVHLRTSTPTLHWVHTQHRHPAPGTAAATGGDGMGRGRAQSMSLPCYPSSICADPRAVPIFNCYAIRSPPRVVFQPHAVAHPHNALCVRPAVADALYEQNLPSTSTTIQSRGREKGGCRFRCGCIARLRSWHAQAHTRARAVASQSLYPSRHSQMLLNIVSPSIPPIPIRSSVVIPW
ncbi:hypothetical protein B0H13DRAFT_889047 [Mycena leptocephala]|nr:hypothetical protein B0H13DRAFT_889047 [Mycena leptocephala]